MGRNALEEARQRVGGDYEPRVLEPSPPAVGEGPWFADDPVARGDVPAGRRLVSPVSGGDLLWDELAAGDAELAAWCAERWLGAYRRLGPAPSALVETRLALHELAEQNLAKQREAANGKIGLRYTHRGFGTPFFGDDRQLRVEGDELVELEAGDERRIELNVDRDASLFLGDWFGFAYSVLEQLRAESRCRARTLAGSNLAGALRRGARAGRRGVGQARRLRLLARGRAAPRALPLRRALVGAARGRALERNRVQGRRAGLRRADRGVRPTSRRPRVLPCAPGGADRLAVEIEFTDRRGTGEDREAQLWKHDGPRGRADSRQPDRGRRSATDRGAARRRRSGLRRAGRSLPVDAAATGAHVRLDRRGRPGGRGRHLARRDQGARPLRGPLLAEDLDLPDPGQHGADARQARGAQHPVLLGGRSRRGRAVGRCRPIPARRRPVPQQLGARADALAVARAEPAVRRGRSIGS